MATYSNNVTYFIKSAGTISRSETNAGSNTVTHFTCTANQYAEVQINLRASNNTASAAAVVGGVTMASASVAGTTATSTVGALTPTQGTTNTGVFTNAQPVKLKVGPGQSFQTTLGSVASSTAEAYGTWIIYENSPLVNP